MKTKKRFQFRTVFEHIEHDHTRCVLLIATSDFGIGYYRTAKYIFTQKSSLKIYEDVMFFSTMLGFNMQYVVHDTYQIKLIKVHDVYIILHMHLCI